jgi:hypothetical protein
VRKEYEKIGILQFENLKDSTEDADIEAPAELVELLDKIGAGTQAA